MQQQTKLKVMKIYKCYYDDGIYSLMFSDDGQKFYSWSHGSSTSYDEYEFSKIEPLETGDTLQEVVDWSHNTDREVVINYGQFYIKGFSPSITPTELLEHIRKPKHTPEELEVLELAKKLNVKIELK